MPSASTRAYTISSPAGAEPVALPGAQRKLVRALWVLAAVFVCTTVGGDLIKGATGHDNLLGLIPQFDLRVEGNIATFFGAILLLAAGFAAACISVVRDNTGARHFGAHWRMLAAIFALLAVDEAASVHELLNAPLRELFQTTGMLYFPWVVPYGVLVAVFAVAFWPFFRSFDHWFRVRIASAGVMYVTGALGMEMMQGLRYTTYGPDGTYFTIWLAGEMLEMAGAILFLYALLRYLATLRAVGTAT